MKKYKLILISFGVLLLALGVGIVIYLLSPFHRRGLLIYDINNSLFDEAAVKLVNIKDWSYDGEYVSSRIDVYQAIMFDYYLDSIGIESSYRDSLLLYTAKECSYSGKECISSKDFSTAEKYFLQGLELTKCVKGDSSIEYAESLCDLAYLYCEIFEYTKAIDYYLKANSIIEKNVERTHESYIGTLNNVGLVYFAMGDLQQSAHYLLRALDCQRNLGTKSYYNSSNTVECLGMIYSEMNDYQKAEEYYRELLEINKDNYSERSVEYAKGLGHLADLFRKKGDYKTAEKYSIQAHVILKSVCKEQSVDYLFSLVGLGSFYTETGSFSKAEQYYTEVLEIKRYLHDKQLFDMPNVEYCLGRLYNDMQIYQKSEQYYLQALDIVDSLIREMPINELRFERGKIFAGLAVCYDGMKDYHKAEMCNLEAIEIIKEFKGEQHLDYATAIDNLGIVYFHKGDRIKAEQCFLKALKIRKSSLEENHPMYIVSLANVGTFYYRTGDYSKAEKYLLRDSQMNKDRYLKSLSYMSEEQRKEYWEAMNVGFGFVYPCFSYRYYSKKPNISTFAYNNELFTKGLLISSANTIYQSIYTSGDTSLIHSYEELKNMRCLIESMNEAQPHSPCISEYKEQAELLEKEIIASSSVYRENIGKWEITWDSVRNHLRKNEVSIEFFTAPFHDDSIMYCALILRHNSKFPIMVPLFEKNTVTSLVNTTNKNETNISYSYNGNGKELSKKIFGKISPHINKGETIYFAAHGLLHQLAIESLPYDEDHTMADIYNLVRLSSTREIVVRKNDVHHSSATLYGGIQYNMSGKEFLAESQRYAGADFLVSRAIADDTNNRGTVSYLKGTKEEVENIYKMMKDNAMSVQLFTSTSANEESFKALSGKHQNILHIATHGFYWTDSTAQKSDYFSQQTMTLLDRNIPTPPTIDPLNRCGLLFAGANTAYSGHSSELPEGVQDGILTAKEISLLDLRDADLVVLSACESGKGEITGEGVFGLQRAFKQAGAQTLIMSLWKVDDKATQLLMTEFYRNWITKHQSKREAFQNAQNTVRSQYTDPYYWAGFIMLD